ncbi:MAG: AAA family ATPase [Bacteroidota bacterium]
MDSTRDIADQLLEIFPFEATDIQKKAMVYLERFLVSTKDNCCFLLKGFAGTGKTTLISALVKYLKIVNISTVLMAPTGRAAKVFSKYSGQAAFTIHKLIYARKNMPDGSSRFVLKENKWKNAIFVVDEASMISDQAGLLQNQWHKSSLLDDLMEYVFTGENCKLILLGDTAQLPPVHMDMSPALDKNHLQSSYNLTIADLELDTVLRQKKHSGILTNATLLRHQLNRKEISQPLLDISDAHDVIAIDSYQFQDELEDAFRNFGEEGVLVVTRSNKNANLYNHQVRRVVFGREEELEAGDKIMVVRNNYHWLKDDKKASYIANGDMAEVLNIQRKEEIYGHNFADVSIRLLDYEHAPELTLKLILDSIYEDGPSLPDGKRKALINQLAEEYLELGSRRLIYQAVTKNEFFNALEIKFGYTVTCHKSQGGQWPIVFIDLGYFTEDMLDRNFIRWLYTALTRASEKVYLVNFPEALIS